MSRHSEPLTTFSDQQHLSLGTFDIPDKMHSSIQKKKPGRKRTKLNKTEMLLANLPPGFTFIGPPGFCTERYITDKLQEDMLCSNNKECQQRLKLVEDSTCQTFNIGSFHIDIELVRVQDLKSMRKLLPRAEYKLLKNRKCARLSRCKRKEQTLSLIEENKRLMSENAWLRT